MKRNREIEQTLVQKFAMFVALNLDVHMDVTTFHRTYAGYWQRAQGAWSWWAYTVKGWEIGSQIPLTELWKNRSRMYLSDNDEFEYADPPKKGGEG